MRLYVDIGKLTVILVLLAAASLLGVYRVISSETVTAILSAAAGYVFGNGRLAARGQPVSPLVAEPGSLSRPPVPVVENDRRYKEEGK